MRRECGGTAVVPTMQSHNQIVRLEIARVNHLDLALSSQAPGTMEPWPIPYHLRTKASFDTIGVRR